MADNTLNFDLDAPAVPTLTLDPTPAAVPQEEKPAAAPAPEAQVNLTPEEQAMVDQFAQKIDITNSQQVLQYGSACQKKIGDFSEAALAKVSTKDLGEVGNMITDLIGELKSFDANEEQQKGILGFFKKKGDQIDNLKTKYNKAETNVENIQSMLEGHQVQLLKDIAMLDKMYDLNMAYFKELSMYILAGKKKLADVRANELQQAMDKAKASGLPEDAQAARDLADQCERFEKKLYDLKLTRQISIQIFVPYVDTAPKIAHRVRLDANRLDLRCRLCAVSAEVRHRTCRTLPDSSLPLCAQVYQIVTRTVHRRDRAEPRYLIANQSLLLPHRRPCLCRRFRQAVKRV